VWKTAQKTEWDVSEKELGKEAPKNSIKNREVLGQRTRPNTGLESNKTVRGGENIGKVMTDSCSGVRKKKPAK